uniref:GIY-YIG domain-containing protein n=1 Tax=Orbilia oligospora TaxID=2813651 RepID=A0A6G6A506_ORBOL|nr:hypothetical protein [Orbilia oligospora]
MWYNRRQCLFKFGYMLEHLLEFYGVNFKKSVNQQESSQNLNSSTITCQISLKIITLIVNDLVFSIRIMIWSICFMQLISNDSLSRLGSSKSFLPSAYSLSPKIKKLGSFSRPYSTYSVKSYNINEIDNNKSISFNSLEQGCEEIKFKYIGVSGVYKLTNKNDPGRFYIGSSVNLARRMEEYNKLTKGLRNPRSLSELEISKASALEWNLEFLYITVPQLSLVYEQYAIIKLKPTINNNLKVIPRVNPQWGNLDNAISVIEKLLSLFVVGSEGYNRLYVFLQTFKKANNLKYELEDIDNKYYCFLVFMYDINSPYKDPIIYSSINRALKGL